MANEFKVKKGLIVEGSGGTILDIQGSVGQLFSITDSLTGDLFAVSDISGIPILNVNSSGAVDIDGDLSITDDVTLSNFGAGYLKTNVNGVVSNTATIPWATVSSTPTTISGYGITDALAIGTTATTAMAGNTTIPSGNAVIDWTTDQGTTNIHSGNYNNTQLSNAEVISAIVASSSIDNTDKGTIRSNIGAGTSSLAIGTTSTTAMAGNTSLFDGAYSSLSSIPSTFAPSAHNHDSRYNSTDGSGDDYRWSVNLGSGTGTRWYKVGTVNVGSGGMTLKGLISNHVESFATQQFDIAIQGREGNNNDAIEITGNVNVLHGGVGVFVVSGAEPGSYLNWDVYIVTTNYSMAHIDLTKTSSTFHTSKSYVTSKPTGTVELDTTTLAEGNYVIDDSVAKEIYHEGHKPTYSELGTMAYSNLSGTPTLGTAAAAATGDFATAAQGTTADAALPKAGGTMTGNVLLQDDVELRFGTDTDLKIYHDGADSRIANNTGHLYIQNLSDDKDILLRSDDGSGGLTTYLNVDGSLGQVSVSKPLVVTDNATISGTLYTGNTITVGDGTDDSKIIIKNFNAVADDIQFYNGTTRVGEIGTTDTTWLRINQNTSKNIYTPRYIRADNGFFVDGTAKGINGSGNFIGGTITGASDANVSNWDTAYTDRNKWDGGSTGLTASTGRTSLGLGTAATTASSDYATSAQGTTADNALPKAGGTMSGTLALDNADSLSFESGKHWITYNDGEGNFNIRVGHKSDSSTNEVSTETGYVFHDEWSQSSGWREFNVSGTSITAGNDVGTWRRQIFYDYNDVRLSYQGGLRLQTTSAGVTVSGNIAATNFSGSSSGTNTGDQDLSSYITSQRAISSTPTDGATTTAISSDWAFDNVKTAVPANALFTDANTTYSAGTGLDLTGTTFSIEPDLRDGVTRIGKDTSNYIAIGADTNVIDFHVGGVWVARMESDGDLHMKGDVIAFSDIFNP